MTRPIYWTPARINDAKTAFLAGIGFADIGAAMEPKRSGQAIRSLLIREGLVALGREPPKRPNAWGPEEEAIVRAHHQKPSPEISNILNKAGYKRTSSAVESYRRDLGLKSAYDPRSQPCRNPLAGWPPMRGEDWERDRDFYRAVLREGVRCGAIQVIR